VERRDGGLRTAVRSRLLEATYGHLAPDQDKTDVEAMDEYDRKLRDAEKDDAETASAASAVGMDV
jgi:hypothetical protein